MGIFNPSISKTETEDGWAITADFGKQGTSRAIVHMAHGTPEEAAANLRELNRVLGRYGYCCATPELK
ncbi:MAG: hypothetical protein RR394_08375 [Oscillospiraceae bacterium]